MIAFTVPGRPQPQGSMKAFVRGNRAFLTSDNSALKDWRAAVGYHALKAGARLLEGPIRIDAAFSIQRPKGHFRTGKNAHLLRDSAPVVPTTKPDLDKLVRAVLDALTGVCFNDDAQVTQVNATKSYALRGEVPSTWIQVQAASASSSRIEEELTQ